MAIDIQPKLPIDRLMFLLSYTLDPAKWRDQFVFSAEPSVFEAVIPSFVAQVKQALSAGLLQGYRREEDALQTVRGRIRTTDQMRRRFSLLLPVEVTFDDFTVDIDENRLIRAAAWLLGRMTIRSRAARQALSSVEALLQSVSLVDYRSTELPRIIFTRLNSHYRPAIVLSRLIIRATSFELRYGEVRASAFLLNMNDVFEDFVVVALREALMLSEKTFASRLGARLYLARDERIRLKPDLSWWERNRYTFVGDAKFKLPPSEVPNADLYQLLGYTIAADVPGGLLIYPLGEREPAAYHIVYANKEIDVAAINLDVAPAALLQQMAQVASRIMAWRARASA